MPKMFLNKRVEQIPKVGDTYKVTGVYPGTTDDLWRPRVEVTLELIEPVKEKKVERWTQDTDH